MTATGKWRWTKSSALSWPIHVAIVVLAFILRAWDVGNPKALVFDEAYYVRQAYSMISHGVEMRINPDLGDKSIEMWNGGNVDVFTNTGDFVVHPPLGKWLIAVGQMVGGVQNPWSWRIAAVLAGSLIVLMVCRIAYRLTNDNTFWSSIAGVLMATEGTSFVQSRTGILDTFVAMFALAAFAAILTDKLAADRTYPRRPWVWRLTAGVMMGACVSTKWTGLLVMAALGLLTVFWDWRRKVEHGEDHPVRTTLLRSAPVAFVQTVVVGVIGYVASWTGWFITNDGYLRNSGNPVAAWLEYQRQMLTMASAISSYHPSQGAPWQWMLQLRPTLFYGLSDGSSYQTITSLGTAPLWWAGCVAVVALFFMAVVWRDWRAAAILTPWAATYLPWFFVGDRTIFQFYSSAFAPYVVLSVVYVLYRIAGPKVLTKRWRFAFKTVAALTVIALAWLAWYWPVYTGQKIAEADYFLRLFIPSWR